MARRSRNWNEDLARDLKDAEFARAFIMASIDEGISVQMTLGKVIRAMGIKEFSRRSKIASSNIIRAIDPRHNPTQATLNRLLRPFDLMLTIAPINSHRTKGAA